MLAPDPEAVFGIAPIRVVSEQRVQAVAFGPLDGPPRLITVVNPLGRESNELEPFAEALDTYLSDSLRQGRLPRIWLPHGAALEVVEILGERYRTNRMASPAIRRMGWQCRAIAEEAKYPGQQAVAVAGELLAAHVVTGQSAIEDRHLDALLAWIDPPDGMDPVSEAQRRSLAPAAAMLERAADDEVEHLRTVAKSGSSARATQARRRIREHLRLGAEREWDLLVRARRAFWSLGLPGVPLGQLVGESRNRLGFALSTDLNPASRPHSLANLLYEYEFAAEQTEDAAVRGDASMRERARRKGKAVMAQVLSVDQPDRRRHPCTLTLRTSQPVLRVRRGTRLQTVDGGALGRVLTEPREDGTGGTLLELRLEKGVLADWRLAVGATLDWVDSVVYDGRYHRKRIHMALAEAAPPLVFGDQPPPPAPRPLPPGSLAAIADTLRRT